MAYFKHLKMLLSGVIYNKNLAFFSISSKADISDIVYYTFVCVKFDSAKNRFTFNTHLQNFSW